MRKHFGGSGCSLGRVNRNGGSGRSRALRRLANSSPLRDARSMRFRPVKRRSPCSIRRSTNSNNRSVTGPFTKQEYKAETCTNYHTVQETNYVAEKYTVQRPVVEYFDTVRSLFRPKTGVRNALRAAVLHRVQTGHADFSGRDSVLRDEAGLRTTCSRRDADRHETVRFGIHGRCSVLHDAAGIRNALPAHTPTS